MKANTLFSLVFITSPLGLHSQIIFEQEYQEIDQVLGGPVLVELSENEHKYMTRDYVNGTFSLYNIDHTPYLLNISAPVPLYQSPDFYEPMLISRSLFDCDDATIEFAVAAQLAWDGPQFWITRTNGDILFTEEYASFPFCYGCAAGTRVDRGVYSTEDGTKMMLYLYDGVIGELRYRIYSLCGTLPAGLLEYPGTVSASLYPNPGNSAMTFELPSEAGSVSHVLEIHNMTGQLVTSIPFQGRIVQFDAATHGLVPGTYTCRVLSNGQAFLSRFVLAP